MEYAFKREPIEQGLDAWSRVNERMERTLAKTIQKAFTRDELADFIRKAIRDGEPLGRNPEMIFWGYDEPHTMPSDGRCEFYYRPTYLMVLTLMAGILQYPDLMHISGLPDTLRRGLNGCTGRGLVGHGFDGTSELMENLNLFLNAGTKDFLDKYPELSPEFTQMFTEIIEGIRSDFENGRHIFDYEEDFKDRQKALLELYDSL